MRTYSDGFQAYGSREQQGNPMIFQSNGRTRRLNRRTRRRGHGPAGLLVCAVVGLVMLGGSLCSKAIDKRTDEGSETHTETYTEAHSEEPSKKSQDFEESPPAYSERPKEL